jgi:iron-sulfur cluster assembly protein
MNDMTPASPMPVSKPKPRPRPQVMRLTEAAAQRITELTKRADSEIVGLRVGVTEMDYKADKMSAQFIFNNPNQTGACGCGESVQLTPAKVDG